MNNGLRVLSLFDGISCGQVALNRAGLKINEYYASEICDYSIKITQKNFPNTIQLGDIKNIDCSSLGKIDLVMGGSPCQSFSFAGKMKGMTTLSSREVRTLEEYLELKGNGFAFEGQSYLFWEYVRILKELKPKYFLLENVKMTKKWKDIITNAVGYQPILINSQLVSAQSRERLYWTNIEDVDQPNDKNIFVDDIVQKDIEHIFLPKTRLDYSNYDKAKAAKCTFDNVATHIGNSRKFKNSIKIDGKAFTLRKINPNGVIDKEGNIRVFTPIEVERLQTLPDNYTYLEGVKTRERYEACGNGWTVDVIAHIFEKILK